MRTTTSALFFVLACSAGNPLPPDPLPAEYTACEVDDDCVWVELGCCDYCNGGVAVSVNTSSEAEVRDAYTQSCSPNQACTEIGCAIPEPFCNEGSCDAAPSPSTTY